MGARSREPAIQVAPTVARSRARPPLLGATPLPPISASLLEYLLVGGATALFVIAVGSVAAALVVTHVMNLSFGWLAGPALGAAAGAVGATVVLGLVGTFAALGQKAAPVLRNL